MSLIPTFPSKKYKSSVIKNDMEIVMKSFVCDQESSTFILLVQDFMEHRHCHFAFQIANSFWNSQNFTIYILRALALDMQRVIGGSDKMFDLNLMFFLLLSTKGKSKSLTAYSQVFSTLYFMGIQSFKQWHSFTRQLHNNVQFCYFFLLQIWCSLFNF